MKSWISKVTRYVSRKQIRSSYVNRQKNYESPRQRYYRKTSDKSTKHIKKNQDNDINFGTLGSRKKSTFQVKKSTKSIRKDQDNDADSGTLGSGKSTFQVKKSTKNIKNDQDNDVDFGTLGSGKSTFQAKKSTKNIGKDNDVDFDALASGNKITYKGKDTMYATKAFNRIMRPAPRVLSQDYNPEPHRCKNLSFTECIGEYGDALHKTFLESSDLNQVITVLSIVFSFWFVMGPF